MCLLSENKKLDLGGICYLSYIALRPYVKGSIQILRHQDPLQYNDVILERGWLERSSIRKDLKKNQSSKFSTKVGGGEVVRIGKFSTFHQEQYKLKTLKIVWKAF